MKTSSNNEKKVAIVRSEKFGPGRDAALVCKVLKGKVALFQAEVSGPPPSKKKEIDE